jgi:hypothetical protein
MQAWAFKIKYLWPSAATLGFKGWMINVNNL